MSVRGDLIPKELKFLQPAVGLVKEIGESIKRVPQFKKIFGDNVYGYKKMDFTFPQLPAVRVWSERFRREYESWFITGDIYVDILLPADIRREHTQTIQDLIAGAMLAHFTRPKEFAVLEEKIPGLNQLGNTFECDKSLGFEWDGGLVPLTRLTLSFRIDLRKWYDHYMPSDNRTKDEPFEQTLGDLERIYSTIIGLRDDFEEEVKIEIKQKQGE